VVLANKFFHSGKQNCAATKATLLERDFMPMKILQDVKLVIMVNEDKFPLMLSHNTCLSTIKGYVLCLLDLSRGIDGQIVDWLEMMKEKLDAQFDYTPHVLDFKHMKTKVGRILKTQ
jgi:hypothetical protein